MSAKYDLGDSTLTGRFYNLEFFLQFQFQDLSHPISTVSPESHILLWQNKSQEADQKRYSREAIWKYETAALQLDQGCSIITDEDQFWQLSCLYF